MTRRTHRTPQFFFACRNNYSRPTNRRIFRKSYFADFFTSRPRCRFPRGPAPSILQACRPLFAVAIRATHSSQMPKTACMSSKIAEISRVENAKNVRLSKTKISRFDPQTGPKYPSNPQIFFHVSKELPETHNLANFQKKLLCRFGAREGGFFENWSAPCSKNLPKYRASSKTYPGIRRFRPNGVVISGSPRSGTEIIGGSQKISTPHISVPRGGGTPRSGISNMDRPPVYHRRTATGNTASKGSKTAPSDFPISPILGTKTLDGV